MRKQRNWDINLLAYALKTRGKAFKWGTTDCATLVRKSMVKVYRKDPFKDLVPAYSDEATAQAATEAVGGLRKVLKDAGFKRVKPNFIHQGDVVLNRAGRGQTAIEGLGVFTGGKVLTSRHDTGVTLLALEQLRGTITVFRMAD